MRRAFKHQPMIAKEIAVIGGEDDNCIFGQSAVFQFFQDISYRIVDHRDHAAGQSACFKNFSFAHSKGVLRIDLRFTGSPRRRAPT